MTMKPKVHPSKRTFLLFATTIFTLFVATPALTLAQDAEPTLAEAVTPIVIGEGMTIHSEILGEDRALLIHKPAAYDRTSAAYPVLYLLDGDAHFHHTTGIINFLSSVGRMSPMLVVALPNTDRTRDLTPALSTDDERFPTAGGADNFLAFITDELMPFVEANYRTAPYKVLVGHSFGGLFAVHALLTRPEAFDAYLSISPSLWWDNKALLPKAEAFFEAHEDLRGFLYMTIANEGGAMLASAWGMAGILEEKAPDGFAWHFNLMEEETHGSIPHRTTYDALEALYADWNIQNAGQLFDEGGLAALDAHYAALSEKFGYEIITPEAMVNQMGYRLMGQQKPEEAIAVLSRNVEVYPASPNVYDSLGDGYDANEQFEEAKASYEKACTMGHAANDPNTQVYCGNVERMAKKMSEM